MATQKTAKKAAKKDGAAKETPSRGKPKSMPQKGKNPKGGLTQAGREFFRRRDGSHLKPGVTGAADTPEKQRRKGSFLTRMFTHPRGPMVKDGEPTRLALSAHAWGEAVPKTDADARKLAAKGRKLLEKYHSSSGEPATKTSPAKAKGGVGAKRTAAEAKTATAKEPAKPARTGKTPARTATKAGKGATPARKSARKAAAKTARSTSG